MNFLAPWFLVGLGAIGVPIVVHLIQKERKEVVLFPSLMFLRRIPYQAVRRQKIRNWLLLLLRVLALLLVVAAFTRPFFAHKSKLAGAILKLGKDKVILLDRSYSMAYGDRWQRAVKAAHEAIDSLGINDRASVVYFSTTATPATPLTRDKAALRKAVDSIRPTAAATRYDVAFRAVHRILTDTTHPQREVLLVSDDQRAGWTGRELPALPVGTTLKAVNLSDSATANILVSQADVRYREDKAAKQERFVVTARVANVSAKPVLKHIVALEVGGREMEKKAVDLPANGTAVVEFAELPVPPDFTPAAVRSAADSLQWDNVYHFVVARKQPLNVLLVQPSQGDPLDGVFVSRALSIGDRPTFKVKAVRLPQVTPSDWGEQALVILDNAPIANDEQGHALVRYVQKGGALLVALGSKSDPAGWPAFAKELLPLPSGEPVDQTALHGAMLGYIDNGHPVFEVFRGPRSGDLSAARFFHYWTVAAGENDRTLARFGDGRPALLERRVGAGRVLVWSSDLDGLWNSMPLQPVFLPFLRQAATYAVNYKDERQAGTIGQLVTPATLFGDDVPPADSAAARRAASEIAQYVALAPDSGQVRFGKPGAPRTLELTEQGMYELRRASGRADKRLVAANVDLAESDLTPFDPALLDAAVAPRAIEDGRGGVKTVEQQQVDLERKQSVWWYLLILAFMVFGAEMLMANRLSRVTR